MTLLSLVPFLVAALAVGCATPDQRVFYRNAIKEFASEGQISIGELAKLMIELSASSQLPRCYDQCHGRSPRPGFHATNRSSASLK